MLNGIIQSLYKNRKLGIPVFWSNVNLGVETVASLFISVIFARFATKELYGQYLFVLAMFGLFTIVSIPGVRTVIFRSVAQGLEGVYKKATYFSLKWALLGIPLLISLGMFYYFTKNNTIGIIVISSAIFFPFVTGLQTWMFLLKGKTKFKKLAFQNLIKFTSLAIIVTTAIVLNQDILFILIFYFSNNTFFNVFFFIKGKKLTKNELLDEGWKKQSYALSIMDLSSLIFNKVDVLLIGTLLPISEVAIYGLVMKFTNIFLKIIRGSIEGILPKLFNYPDVHLSYFFKFFVLSLVIPILLFPILFYPVILLYGSDYVDVVYYAQIYIFVIPFYVMTSIMTNLMVKYQMNKEINVSRIIAIIAVILSYCILIPYLGILGGVIGSIIYFFVSTLCNWYFIWRYESASS